jgi:taurine dioxygenase
MTVLTDSLQLGARRIAGRAGAVIDAVDLRDELSEETISDLHRLLGERGVVIFTNQKLDPPSHLAFARQLGEIRIPPDYFPTLREQGYPEIGVLVSEPGRGNGADTWHADVTWSPRPPRYSVLHMQVTPPAGGDTMWASLTEAYERLSAPSRERRTASEKANEDTAVSVGSATKMRKSGPPFR